MKTKLAIHASCLSLILSLTIIAQTPPAPSPANQQLTSWLAVYDGNNWDAYLEFLKTNFAAPPGRGFQDPAFRDRNGGYDLKKIEQQSPTRITALLAERASDNFARLTLEVEPQPPYRILTLHVDLTERPAEFALPHLDQASLIAALHKYLDAQTATDKFAGAVVVARNGQPIFAEAYGLANREQHIPNTLDTRFSIGSMNKMFTAVATMQLVQAGKLSLNDPLAKHLTDYPNKDLAAKVTIAQLLTNTGGTGDIWGPEFDQHRLELRTIQDYINLYGNRPLRFEPGSRYEYSNYGFILLGAIIQKVSGEDYYAYIRDHIYLPSHMTASGSELNDTATTHPSTNYIRMGSPQFHPVTDAGVSRGTPAGGGYSTTEDMLRFAKALQQNKLLNPQFTTLLITPQVKNPFGMDAYGFGVQTLNGNQCVGHNGGAPGVNGDLETCDNFTYTVVVLSNIDPPAADQASHFIINRLSPPAP